MSTSRAWRRGVFGRVLLNASGHVGLAAVNRVLGRYDIAIAGDFEATALAVVADESARASGAIAWSGVRTFCRLSGQNYDTALSAMVAEVRTVDGECALEAKLADDPTAPLVHACLQPDGWVGIGLARRFSALVVSPRPSSGNDDAAVVAVEEQLVR